MAPDPETGEGLRRTLRPSLGLARKRTTGDRGGFDYRLAHEPEQGIEGVVPEIEERAAARLSRVSHPLVLGGETTIQAEPWQVMYRMRVTLPKDPARFARARK